jgi:LPS-assembly protein
MRSRNLVFITLLVLCHSQLRGQTLTNALPPSQQQQAPSAAPASSPQDSAARPSSDSLPDDPDQQLLPVAKPEPPPATGTPVQASADSQSWAGNVWTGIGSVEFHYRDYILHADKVTYDQRTSEVHAEGHVQVAGGPNDILINADHGDMRLDLHTGRFYQVSGSQGVRSSGHSVVFSTANPFLFSGRVLIETGEGEYRIVDGSMTNCHLPKPDWRIISRSINLTDGEASARNSIFKFLGIPIFYLPYVRHPTDDTGRESGFLIPYGENSSIKGLVIGEQVYWVINRSMDMVVGSEYYSKRGWAPNGDFRYKGPALDHMTIRWNALLDRGIEEPIGAVAHPGLCHTYPCIADRGIEQPMGTAGATFASGKPHPDATAPAMELVNQGGVDITALGRKELSPETRVAGIVEYLSSYVYRLVFDDNYSQAINSEVSSDVSLTHAHDGFMPSVSLNRFQTFGSATNGDEARILHLPNLRYDVLDRPLGSAPVYWGLGSSLNYLSRSEPDFHAHNAGRVDVYPHLSLPLSAGGWNFTPEFAVRDTFYTDSQIPNLNTTNGGTPTFSHTPLNRADIEAGIDIRPPALERDFSLPGGTYELRHVIEPELTYRYVGGIGPQAQNVLLVDTADIATNTNEADLSITQRFYLRNTSTAQPDPTAVQPCVDDQQSADKQTTDKKKTTVKCPAHQREWASWQLAAKFFFDPYFGGAVIPGRRNVFDTTLDLTGIAFLTDPRNLSPITSRLRFEVIKNLRIEWDVDFDPKAGRQQSDNLYAGYSWANTTIGVGHEMLNAVDENNGAASTIQSQQVQPFVYVGKQNRVGFNFAANASYDFVQGALQYAGVQAVYNWDCCGLTIGYRQFELGSLRDEHEYLYSFTLANFGNVGTVRRTNSVFRDPLLPPAY